MTVKTATLEEIRAMKDRGELSPPSKDAKESDLPADFWDDAKECNRLLNADKQVEGLHFQKHPHG